MKLSATVTPRWEGVVSRGEASYFELKLIYSVQYLQANHLYSPCRRAFLYYMYTHELPTM